MVKKEFRANQKRRVDIYPKTGERLKLFDLDNPDIDLFNMIDDELIRISGSELLIYKFEIDDNFDDVYGENRAKAIRQQPVLVEGHYDPRMFEENLTQFGIEMTNDQTFTFNKSYIEDKLGRPLIPGDIIQPRFQNVYFDIYEVQEDSFEVYGVYHLVATGRVLRETEKLIPDPVLTQPGQIDFEPPAPGSQVLGINELQPELNTVALPVKGGENGFQHGSDHVMVALNDRGDAYAIWQTWVDKELMNGNRERVRQVEGMFIPHVTQDAGADFWDVGPEPVVLGSPYVLWDWDLHKSPAFSQDKFDDYGCYKPWVVANGRDFIITYLRSRKVGQGLDALTSLETIFIEVTEEHSVPPGRTEARAQIYWQANGRGYQVDFYNEGRFGGENHALVAKPHGMAEDDSVGTPNFAVVFFSRNRGTDAFQVGNNQFLEAKYSLKAQSINFTDPDIPMFDDLIKGGPMGYDPDTPNRPYFIASAVTLASYSDGNKMPLHAVITKPKVHTPLDSNFVLVHDESHWDNATQAPLCYTTVHFMEWNTTEQWLQPEGFMWDPDGEQIDAVRIYANEQPEDVGVRQRRANMSYPSKAGGGWDMEQGDLGPGIQLAFMMFDAQGNGGRAVVGYLDMTKEILDNRWQEIMRVGGIPTDPPQGNPDKYVERVKPFLTKVFMKGLLATDDGTGWDPTIREGIVVWPAIPPITPQLPPIRLDSLKGHDAHRPDYTTLEALPTGGTFMFSWDEKFGGGGAPPAVPVLHIRHLLQ